MIGLVDEAIRKISQGAPTEEVMRPLKDDGFIQRRVAAEEIRTLFKIARPKFEWSVEEAKMVPALQIVSVRVSYGGEVLTDLQQPHRYPSQHTWCSME